MQGSNVDKDGNLKPCIACDEYKSGPGFKYTAARTRRWSPLNQRSQEVRMKFFM